ncbi:MAG: HEAT repeat domain-containing protein, partial [Fibrella sp.]|nr:HEAT repeat domain-containing protein [Armatimonadota bacterium]
DSGGRRQAARVLMRCGAEGFAALLPLRHRFAELYTELDSPESTRTMLDLLRESRSCLNHMTESKFLQELHRRGVDVRDVAIELLDAPEVSLRWRGAGFLNYARGELSAVRDKAYRLYQAEPTDYTWLQLLAKSGDRRAAAPLLRELGKRMDEYERANVIDALGDTRDPSAVDVLVGYLDHRSDSVRSSAAKALGKIGDDRAVEPIRARLEKDSVHVKIRRAWERHMRGEKVGGNYFESLTKKAAVQMALATALVRLDAPDAAAEMIHCLPYFDEQQTYHSVSPLPGLSLLGRSAIPALVNALDNDADPSARMVAASALAELGDVPEAVEPLVRLLTYTEPPADVAQMVRGAAEDALGKLGDDERARSLLYELLLDERSQGHSSAIRVLAGLRDARAAPFLVRHLTTDKGGWIYNTDTLDSLFAMGREVAFPLLAARFATETDAAERTALLYALAWLSDKRAIPLLREQLAAQPGDWPQPVLPIALAYLEAAPEGWLAPQWE